MLTKREITFIKGLSRKPNREIARKFIIEGEKLVSEMIHSGWGFSAIYAVDEWASDHLNLEVIRITQKELERISQLKTPNKVMAIVDMRNRDSSLEINDGLTLFLDRINDPGNLGTIMRVADWFGIRSIICTTQSVDQYHPKVVQSSMGSVFRVTLFYADGETYLQRYTTKFPNHPILGAAVKGDSLYKTAMPLHGLLVMGSESHGIDPNITAYITQNITISGTKGAESLNVAIATGIILWEWHKNTEMSTLPLKQ